MSAGAEALLACTAHLQLHLSRLPVLVALLRLQSPSMPPCSNLSPCQGPSVLFQQHPLQDCKQAGASRA